MDASMSSLLLELLLGRILIPKYRMYRTSAINSGIPISAYSKNENPGKPASRIAWSAMMFGGVPVKVKRPPVLAAKAKGINIFDAGRLQAPGGSNGNRDERSDGTGIADEPRDNRSAQNKEDQKPVGIVLRQSHNLISDPSSHSSSAQGFSHDKQTCNHDHRRIAESRKSLLNR